MQTQLSSQVGSSSGILSALAGGEGFGSSLPAGLQGLFAALVAGGQQKGAEGVEALLQTTLGAENAEGVLAAVQGEGVLENILSALEGVEFSEGTELSVTIEQLTVQLQQCVVSLEESGLSPMLLGKPDEFALALHQQGMPLEEAIEQAQRIQSAMDYVRKELGLEEAIGEENQSVLAFINAMNSTTSLTQVEAEVSTVSLQATQVEVTGVVREQQVAAFAAQKEAAPVHDIAAKVLRDQPLVRLPGSKAAVSEAAISDGLNAVDGEILEGAAAEKVEGAQRAVAQQEVITGEELAEELPVVTARQRVGDFKAPVGEEKPVSKTVTDMISTDAGAEGLPSGQIRVTEAPAPLQGTTMFKWQSTKVGMDVVTQMQDNPLQMEGAIDGMDGALDEGMSSDKAAETRPSSFAEKMAAFARHAQVGNQVAPAMKTLSEQGGGQVRVTLNPEELGEVDIELHIKDGKVHGTIASQNPEVVEQLARELQQLKQGLTEAGYQLGDEGIAFMLQDQNQGGSGHQQNGDDPTQLAEGADEQETAVEGTSNMAAAQWVSPDQLVDVRV